MVAARQRLEDLLRHEMSLPPPERPPQKKFAKANPEIPTLENYEDDPGEEFWAAFPSHLCLDVKAPFEIDTDELLRLCKEANYNDLGEAEAVVRDFLFGCDQLVNRDRFWPTHNVNNPSIVSDEFAERVVDAL